MQGRGRGDERRPAAGGVMDRVSFGLGGPASRRARPPVRGFDFGRGLERERMAHGPPRGASERDLRAGGSQRDLRAGPTGGGPGGAWHERGGPPPPSMQLPPRPKPGKLLGKMSGLRQAVAAQVSEKQEAAAKEDERQKRKEKEALEKATKALAAAETSEDPSKLRSAALLAEPFPQHASAARAAKKRARRVEAVESLMAKAQKAADHSHKQDIETLTGTINALKAALAACGEFKRLGNEEELRSQLALAESRRSILEEHAAREKTAAKGLDDMADNEDIDDLNAAVAAAVVFESLSKQTAVVQSRIKRLEQAQHAVAQCRPQLLESLSHPQERIDRLNVALDAIGEFKTLCTQEPRLRDQLARAQKQDPSVLVPADEQRKNQSPPPLPAVPKSGKAAPVAHVDSVPVPAPSPRTIPHEKGTKLQPKTALIRVHKEQMSLVLPMFGGDYLAHRSAKESTALSRKRKEALQSHQVHLFRVDGFFTSGQEQDFKLCDPRPSREYIGRNLADKQYRPVGFSHNKETSGIRYRTVFVDKLVAPTNPDHVAECFDKIGRVHEVQVWTVPPLMDQPARCFAVVSVATTAAAVTAFINDVGASIRSQSGHTTTAEEKVTEVLTGGEGGVDMDVDTATDLAGSGWTSSIVSRPTANAVRLASMAIRAGSAVVVAEDNDRKLIECAQKELRDAQSLLSSIDASVSMSSSSAVRSQTFDSDVAADSTSADSSACAAVSPASTSLSTAAVEQTQIDARVARFKNAISEYSNEAVFATPSYFSLPEVDEVEADPEPTEFKVEPDANSTVPDEAKKAVAVPSASSVEGHASTPLKPAAVGDRSPASGDPSQLTSPLQRTRSVKKLKKRVPAVKTIVRFSGVSSVLISKMLCEHFAGRCQHRFEPASAELEQGIW